MRPKNIRHALPHAIPALKNKQKNSDKADMFKTSLSKEQPNNRILSLSQPSSKNFVYRTENCYRTEGEETEKETMRFSRALPLQ